MASWGEARPDTAADKVLGPAWSLRWRAPELALMLAERAGSAIEPAGDGPDRLRAEATVVVASCRLGRRLDVVDRAIDAIRLADGHSDGTTSAVLRIEVAGCARAAGVPLVGAAVLRPVLTATGIRPAMRANALVQLTGCLTRTVDPAVLDDALAEADRLYDEDRQLDPDSRLVLRALLRSVASGEQRRRGDARAAVRAAQEGADLLGTLDRPTADNGQAGARVALRLVHGLLDLGRMDEAGIVAATQLRRPVRAPAADAIGWLSVAMAVRTHLATGALPPAMALLREAAELGKRHRLSSLRAEALTILSDAHERVGQLAEALDCLRTAQGVRLRRARVVYSARTRLVSAFGETTSPEEFVRMLDVPAGRRSAAGREQAADLLSRVGMHHPLPTPVDTGARPAPGADVTMVLVDVAAPGGGDTPGAINENVLSHVLDRLRAAAPSEAQVARVGGAELVVLLPGAPAAQAQRWVNDLRGAMASVDWTSFTPGLTVAVRAAVAHTGHRTTDPTPPTPQPVAAQPIPAHATQNQPPAKVSPFELPTVPIAPLSRPSRSRADRSGTESAAGQEVLARAMEQWRNTKSAQPPAPPTPPPTPSTQPPAPTAQQSRSDTQPPAAVYRPWPDAQSSAPAAQQSWSDARSSANAQQPWSDAQPPAAAQQPWSGAGAAQQYPSGAQQQAPSSEQSRFGAQPPTPAAQQSLSSTQQSAPGAHRSLPSAQQPMPSAQQPQPAAQLPAQQFWPAGPSPAPFSFTAAPPATQAPTWHDTTPSGVQPAQPQHSTHSSPAEQHQAAQFPLSADPSIRISAADIAAASAPTKPQPTTPEPGQPDTQGEPEVSLWAPGPPPAEPPMAWPTAPDTAPTPVQTAPEPADAYRSPFVGSPFTDPIGDPSEPSRPRHAVDTEEGRSVLSSLGIAAGGAGTGRRRAKEDAPPNPEPEPNQDNESTPQPRTVSFEDIDFLEPLSPPALPQLPDMPSLRPTQTPQDTPLFEAWSREPRAEPTDQPWTAEQSTTGSHVRPAHRETEPASPTPDSPTAWESDSQAGPVRQESGFQAEPPAAHAWESGAQGQRDGGFPTTGSGESSWWAGEDRARSADPGAPGVWGAGHAQEVAGQADPPFWAPGPQPGRWTQDSQGGGQAEPERAQESARQVSWQAETAEPGRARQVEQPEQESGRRENWQAEPAAGWAPRSPEHPSWAPEPTVEPRESARQGGRGAEPGSWEAESARWAGGTEQRVPPQQAPIADPPPVALPTPAAQVEDERTEPLREQKAEPKPEPRTGRRRRSVQLADLLTEALMAYQTAQDANDARNDPLGPDTSLPGPTSLPEPLAGSLGRDTRDVATGDRPNQPGRPETRSQWLTTRWDPSGDRPTA